MKNFVLKQICTANEICMRGGIGVTGRSKLQCRLPLARNVWYSQISAARYESENENVLAEVAESKELILSVLRANATKRDARAYINKYSGTHPMRLKNDFAKKLLNSVSEAAAGFDLYGSAPIELRDMMRVALIKVRYFSAISDDVLAQIGRTIRRLARLGLSPVIIVDPKDDIIDCRGPYANLDQCRQLNDICLRIAKSIETPPRRIETAIDFYQGPKPSQASEALPALFTQQTIGSPIQWTLPHLLLIAMINKTVPIISPLVYVEDESRYAFTNANDVVYQVVDKITGADAPEIINVEKVIYIDPLGGIPSEERKSSAHILVNLEQESETIINELRFPSTESGLDSAARKIHLENLQSFRQVLAAAPSTTTGLITTPEIAALQSTRNPLIYNLLTDRPVISSSLPVDGKKVTAESTTLLRHGMPVMILSSPKGMSLPQLSTYSWPGNSGVASRIFNGTAEVAQGAVAEIDMVKFVGLIENSFRRELDVEHYLSRINGKVAALIIAGDYEGGAIITWETLPSSGTRVAYLDKFAVLSKNQGSAGVADIVFKAMIHLFPEELIWRSRTENPINRWYFDRSKGSLRVQPDRKWTIFWTGTKTREVELLQDYVHACASIVPSFK
ncbi:uncharacterized protein V1516DRAFT_677693 [Lipomyces oligophaga]|uniref:uncharacterized protein n=1 Tax=Lipomyces oligophaga TaxID=45792 RepID=UPI0034CE26D0